MIPVCEPSLGEGELKNVSDCIRTGWISSKGKYIDEFEKKFADFCGTRFAVSVCNGTVALHLALASCGIGKGDEVILPDFTMVSPAMAVAYTGAKPVFADAERKTWNIDPEKIECLITKRTKAILPVHIYGHPCDMKGINEIAKSHDLIVIEDAAEAHGAECEGRRTGSLGDCGCFSFYANKIVTTGEGGMVTTDDRKICEKAKSLKNICFDAERRYIHSGIGFNYRMTNLQAAVGSAQMDNVEEFVGIRRKNAMLYNSLLKDVEGITLPAEEPWAKNVYWMYTVLVEDSFGMSRDILKKELFGKGIDTRFSFTPMRRQPCFGGSLSGGEKTISDDLWKRGLNLPSGLTLKEEEIRYICDTIKGLQR